MKVLVTYYSETGNTEKLARAIYEGIGKVEKQILPIKEVEEEPFDLIFCGFPVKESSVPSQVQRFLKDLPEGQRLALFATHGSLRGGQLAVTAFEHATILASNAKVIGKFGCRGKVKWSLIEELMKHPAHKSWAEQAQGAVNNPDEADLEDARNFANEMISKKST